MLKKIILVVGARPNFMKSAPLLEQLDLHPESFETILVHTGQHYSYELSNLFFEQLKMRAPDVYMGVGSGSHAWQTAQIMIKLEELFIKERPNLVVVFGDVNSTLAAAIAASKLCIDMAHVEAGLRSFDNTMPEEINRIVTDRLSEYLFVTEESGVRNLKNEGTPDEKVFFTGNIMIDSLKKSLVLSDRSEILEKLSLTTGEYATLTLHRPSNVDDISKITELLKTLDSVGKRLPVVFPCHPRTTANLKEFGLTNTFSSERLIITDPLGYLDFLKLMRNSRLVLTDSGGIQEETTYMGIPCLTLRDNTERPVTAEIGTNQVIGTDPGKILTAVELLLDGSQRTGKIPEFWDGRAAERIAKILRERI